MTQSITNAIQIAASLLRRDVRDLFKVGGRLVDEEFLDALRNSLENAGMDRTACEWVAAEVRSAYWGRMVQMDELLQMVKMRIKERLD